MIEVKVKVDGDFKSVIKHVAGGVDREVREVGPNEEVTFEFKEFMGDNLFIVGAPAPVEVSHVEVQEEAKNVTTREAMDAKENAAAASDKSSADKNKSAAPSDDKSKATEASKSSSGSSAKK